MEDLAKWIRIRKDLYLQMEREVQARLGEDTPELMRYRQVYDREFTRKWTLCRASDLWQEIAQAQVVMIGDFHALHQSQKAQVRVLRHLPSERPKVLAVEFVEAADQEALDQFMEGRLSERDFLKQTQWQVKWGFPWEHYRPILRWAQVNKVRVYGINRSYKKRTATTLKSRDVFAGKKITELVRRYPEALVCVIYGDLHLAKEHIPGEVIKNLGSAFAKKILRIFQNSERIYLQLLKREEESATDLIRFSKNDFCLMSVPPWVKWQNYLMYLEQAYDVELDEDDEEGDFEDLLDYGDHVGRYVQIMSEELGCDISIGELSVYTAQDSAFWIRVKEVYSAKDLKWIEAMIAEEMSFYLPEAQVCYLARASVNHAATLAMMYIHGQLSRSSRILNQLPNDFAGLIWAEGLAYFGSKMINHKRKTDTISDMKLSLTSKGAETQGKEALKLALGRKMQELQFMNRGQKSEIPIRPRQKWSYVTAAALLGGILGERLYFGYQKRMLAKRTLIDMLKKPVSDANFEDVYYEMLEIVEAIPVPFQSKKEKL